MSALWKIDWNVKKASSLNIFKTKSALESTISIGNIKPCQQYHWQHQTMSTLSLTATQLVNILIDNIIIGIIITKRLLVFLIRNLYSCICDSCGELLITCIKKVSTGVKGEMCCNKIIMCNWNKQYCDKWSLQNSLAFCD